MRKTLFTLALLLVLVPQVDAQDKVLKMANHHLSGTVKAEANLKAAKAAAAAMKQAERQSNQAARYFRKCSENYQNSAGLFGGLYYWNATDKRPIPARLSYFENGRIVLISKSNKLITIKPDQLAEVDKFYFDLYRQWLKWPKKDRLQWARHYEDQLDQFWSEKKVAISGWKNLNPLKEPASDRWQEQSDGAGK